MYTRPPVAVLFFPHKTGLREKCYSRYFKKGSNRSGDLSSHTERINCTEREQLSSVYAGKKKSIAQPGPVQHMSQPRAEPLNHTRFSISS